MKMTESSNISIVTILCFGLFSFSVEQPLNINPSTPTGKDLANFSCSGKGNLTANGINSTVFRLNGGHVLLDRKPLAEDFPVIDCLHTANNIEISARCEGQSLQTNWSVFYDPQKKPHNSTLCDWNCRKINQTLYVSEDTAVNAILFNFKICDDDDVFTSEDINGINVDFLNSIYVEDKRSQTSRSLILKKELDYENEAKTFSINYTVNGAPGHIELVVTDADDLGVAFTEFIYECYMEENTTMVRNCSVSASDMDKGLNTSVSYSLEAVKPILGNIKFKIGNDGYVTSDSPLDRETQSTYQLLIKGFQTDKPIDRVNYTSMVIYVTDIDDNPPVMSQPVYNVSVMENSPNGTIICYVSATDNDQGDNAKFFYKLDSNTFFDVGETTGAVTVKGEIDREKNTTIILYVHVESYTKQHNSTISTINVTVVDENDNSPNITSSNTVQINKTMANGNVVMEITATDYDEGLNKQLNYSMYPPSDIFEMDSNGTIRLHRSLNDTNKLQYQLNVIVHDCPQSEKIRRYSSMVLNVTVNDVNIHPPEFQNFQQEVHILEDAENGTILLVLRATDKDPTDQLTFSISSRDNDSRFTIDDNRLILKNSLDREKRSSYNLSIQVFDGEHNVTNTTTVLVDDVNDNDPVFKNQTYQFRTEEEQVKVLGHVKATDEDFNQSITYTLEQGTLWNQYIRVDEANGTVSLLKKLDRENISVPVSFLVFATDNGQQKRVGNATITIQIKDINDNRPVFETNVTVFRFDEFTPPTNFYNATASDDDITEENRAVFYGLGNIDPVVADLFVVFENGSVNFSRKLELKNINTTLVTFTIEAYNKVPYSCEGMLNNSQTVKFFITDVNQRPYFENESISCSVDEGNVPRSTIPLEWTHTGKCKIIVIDEDLIPEYKNISYTLINDTSGVFELEKYDSGVRIKQVKDINYDPPSNNHYFNFSIKAFNMFPLKNGTESSAILPVFLTIIDVDDSIAMFAKETIECHVNENHTGPIDNCFVKAEDNDEEKYKTPSNYTFEEGFKLSTNGELELTKPLDFETTPNYVNTTVNVTSLTPGTFNETSCRKRNYCTMSCHVIIEVVNINDNPPEFKNKSYTFIVSESNLTSILIGELAASDPDGDDFNISVTNIEYFSVIQNGNSAYILTKKTIDYETQQNFTMTANVSDGKYTGTANVTILVTPVNEYPPTFDLSTYTWNLNQTSNLSETFTLHVSDMDIHQPPNFTYRIIGGNDQGLFGMSDGKLVINKSLINNRQQHVTLTIESTDNDESPLPLSSKATVNIIIHSVNLHPPSFIDHQLRASVKESNETIEVLQVIAKDIDSTQDNLTFSVRGNEQFFFNATQGPPWMSTLYARKLDAEHQNGTYTIQIKVSDGLYEDNATVNVTIEDENEYSPWFTEIAYNKSIRANVSVGSEVLHITAMDTDISNVGFTFILYDSSGDYEINENTGSVSLVRPLGKNGKQYFMQVEVLDHGSPPRSNRTNVTLTIDDTSPPWTLVNCSADMPENDISISFQLSLCIRNTSVHNFTYQIISDNKLQILQNFSLNNSSGEFKLASGGYALDFEKQSIYSFQLQVYDSGIFPKSQNCWVTIHVTDLNEEPTITNFENEIYQEQNTTNGTFVYHIKATDPDTKNASFSRLKFSLSSDSTFAIDSNSGNITVKVLCLLAGNYSLNIKVTDGGSLTAEEGILIIVPAINVTNLSKNLTEGRPTNVFDLSPTGSKYTILLSPYMGYFMTAENGTLLLIDPLDREVTEHVSLRILGRNMTNNILLHDITVNITVIDVNDCPPIFAFHNLTIYIDDITIPGTIIGYMPAKDDDKDETNRHLIYSIEEHEHITATNLTDLFSASNDGRITVKSAVMPGYYQFILRVTDGHFNDTVDITVSVRNTNDHSPVFTNKTYIFTITETNNTNITVGQVNATDIDSDTIYYNFSTAIDIFQIDQKGIISTKVPVNRETKDLYTLYVQATDNQTNPREDICNVTIIVTDVNDNYPQFQASHYSGTVMENSQANTTIQILPPIIATDKDNGKNGTKGIHFSLNENTHFCIDTKIDQDVALGTVYVCKTPIDRETKDEYNLTLYASDGKGLNTSATLTVHVLDDNDETPLFNKTDYVFNVTENVHVPYIIGNVSVTDSDLNGTQTVRFGLQNGGEGKFYISPISGQIYATGNIDREEKESYSLNVSAYDGIHTNYTEVLIHVIDVNDNAPDFKLPNLTAGEVFVVQVTEDSPPGSIFNFSASDKDSDQTVTFSFNGTKPFNLTKDGQLKLESTLDRETNESYILMIIASDNGNNLSLSTILTVKIVVLDINDNSPTFFVDNVFANETKCSTIEKAPLMSVLKLFRTVDGDFGINGTVSYTIEPSDVSNYFNVEQQEKTGILLIKQSLVVNTLMSFLKNGNNDTVELNVTIVATDGGGLKSTLLIQVRVEPLNDEDIPVFTSPTYNIEVYENVTQGSVVGEVTATIPNATVSHLHYTWIGNVAAFQVSETSGNITTFQQLDRESRSSYTLAVQVRDGRIPERTAFAAVEIRVLDVNDNSPEFKYNYLDNLFIPENTTIYKKISFAAFDRDSGQNAEITYYVREENNDSRFWIDNSTGILTINGTFDYENKHSYNLQIVAVDKGFPEMSNSTNITVQITDVNDNAPIFTNDSCKMFNITENSLHSEPICRVEAIDHDSGLNGKIVYGIFNSFTGPFNVHPINGSIYLEGMLDYEAQSSYILVILAQDQGNSSLTATLTVNVAVHDVYDDVPKFDKQVFETTVSSSAAVNTTVIDLDINITQPNFTIQGSDADYFKIDSASGNISVAKMLDSKRENYAFTVVVYASQNAIYNASAIVLVKLTGRDITFNKSEIVVRLAENLEGNQIVYDLNTTEESEPTGAAYSIISVDPESGKKIFNIDESTGIVTCNQTLDREVAKTYVILIAAQSKNARKKRDTSVTSTTFRLVINVTDVNDNSPYFPEDHPYIFGVPDDARAYYLVTTVKANDPDEFDQLRYDILGERYVFNIDTRTGDLRTTAAIASANRNEFNMTILVDDGGGIHHNATLDIIIQVVPTRNQPILFINKTVADLVKQKNIIEKNMSDILGVIVQIEKIQSHRFIGEDKVFRVDISSSDLYFHGFNKTTNTMISNEEMKKLLEAFTEPLARLFGSKTNMEYAVISPLIADPSAINSSQILMICMAVFILIGTSALLVWSQYSWTKYEKEQIESLRERIEREHNDIELNSIRSRQSSKLSSLLAAAAANPGFEETEFLSNGELYPGMKNEPQYESQELRMTFGDEPIEAHIPAENLQDFVQSVVDSGVGNTSVHSGQNRESAEEEDRQSNLRSIDDEGPVMTSSPRLHRDAQQSPSTSAGIVFLDVDKETKGEVPDVTSDRSSTIEVNKKAGLVVMLDATGETETDDELDESEENNDDKIAKTATVTESASGNRATDVILFKQGEHEHECEAAVESTAF